MKTQKIASQRLAIIALTLIVSLVFNPASACPTPVGQTEDSMVDASKLTDWNQKVNLKLTAALDQRLNQQLLQSTQNSQTVLTRNLTTTTAQRIQQPAYFNQNKAVTASLIMPVDMSVKRKDDNLLNR